MFAAPLYNELHLLQRLAEKDETAFTTLYEHYRATVSRVILKFIKHRELADDLCQEVFLKVWKNHAVFKTVHSFQAYLIGLTKNHCLDTLKKAAQVESVKAELIRQARLQRDVSMEVIMVEYISELRKVYDGLPTQTKRVFDLVKGEGRSYEEVAALLGVSRSAVNKHLVRSNKAFDAVLKKELGISLPALLLLTQNNF